VRLFKGKYRIQSGRLRGWDYSAPGWYFITVCTKDLKCFLGDVVDKQAHLSSVGQIVAEEWQRTERIRPRVKLDEWVVIPNHLHGIIILEETSDAQVVVETPRRGVSTLPALKSNSLGSIIGQFKSVCTKRIRTAGVPEFAWQSRFYDHIIRDESSLHEVRQYIANNPLKWELDRNNPTHLKDFSCL
jgi:REP element-mobilizing transposase RayT